MRMEDFRDYLRLRRFTLNPWEIVRFRKNQAKGRELAVRMRRGGPIYVRGGTRDFHIFHRIFLRDEYKLNPVTSGGMECAVDLGANAGFFSCRVSESARRIIAYEPHPGNFAQLERNTASRDNIESVPEAVGGRTETLRLYRPRDEGLTGAPSTFREMDNLLSEKYDEIPAVTLEDLFVRHEINACDLLKIDVEGKEYDILHEAGDDVLSRIHRIHGEYHNVEPDNPRTRIEHFVAFLRSKGFEVEKAPHRRRDNHGLFFAARS